MGQCLSKEDLIAINSNDVMDMLGTSFLLQALYLVFVGLQQLEMMFTNYSTYINEFMFTKYEIQCSNRISLYLITVV